MKTKFIILSILIFSSSSVISQSLKPTFTTLICKKWCLKTAQQNTMGNINQKDSSFLIFHKNHKYETITSYEKQIGSWSYDSVENKLSLKEDNSDAVLKLKIIKITPDNCTLEMKSTEGIVTLLLVPVGKIE